MSQSARTALPAYVLAGGQGRRFGADKLRYPLDGVPLVKQIATRLALCCSRVVLVAGADDAFADLGLLTIADSGQQLGPLDGLAAALADLRPSEDRLLLAAGDLWGIEPVWVERLCAATGPADVWIFAGDNWQPLFGVYQRAVLPLVQEQLAAGRYSIKQLLARLDVRAVAAPPGWERVININYPDELPAD
ncbi:MAG: molybdenum cofactor guanylyltransferase [Deltaproteobacteria bacterium]|nr:molybdenum cofactor guanylyltransferase [Deltaproteobacteria bacterium]